MSPVGAFAAACEATGPEMQIAVVLAADSVRLADGRIVRLAAIDVPDQPEEVASRLPTARERRSGVLPPTRGSGSAIIGAADRYGRFHANVFADDGGLIQAALVGEGVARVLIEPGKPLQPAPSRT